VVRRYVALQMRALGQTASGTITAQEEKVVIVVTLPWLLANVAERILPAIRRQATLSLENK